MAFINIFHLQTCTDEPLCSGTMCGVYCILSSDIGINSASALQENTSAELHNNVITPNKISTLFIPHGNDPVSQEHHIHKTGLYTIVHA